jgi:hypothetical protein
MTRLNIVFIINTSLIIGNILQPRITIEMELSPGYRQYTALLNEQAECNSVNEHYRPLPYNRFWTGIRKAFSRIPLSGGSILMGAIVRMLQPGHIYSP